VEAKYFRFSFLIFDLDFLDFLIYLIDFFFFFAKREGYLYSHSNGCEGGKMKGWGMTKKAFSFFL